MTNKHFLPALVLMMSLGVLSAFAQSGNFCGLTIKAMPEEGDQVIKNVTVTAIDEEINRVYYSVTNSDPPFIPKLPEATYKLILSRQGYKKSAYLHTLNCSELESGSHVTVSVPMIKGNSNEIVTLQARPIGAFKIGAEDVGPPSPPSSPSAPKIISKGVINGIAIQLAKPEYPPAAAAVGAAGAVHVQVTIDEEGNVISAVASSGHPLLRSAAVDAASRSKFKPTLLEGVPVKVMGIIVYNFR